MRDAGLLIAWLAAVVGVTFLHDPLWLGVLAAAILASQGREAVAVVRRALVAVLFVNLTVSVAWIVNAWLNDLPWLMLVLRLNLRVLVITLLTLIVFRHVDLVRASRPWPSARFLVVLALGQIRALSQALADYRDAFASRSPTPAPLSVRFSGAGRQAAALIEKGERRAEDLNQGMRSRGFFDDRT